MANRTIEAILRLSAKAGSMAGFQRVASNLDKIDRKTKAFNRSQSVLAKSNRALYATALRYAAPAVLGAAAVSATKDFAALERRLTRIGITAEASSEDMDAAFSRVRQIADDLSAPVENVVDGLESLVASGKTLDEAMALLPEVSAAAQAADADFNSMATTADAIAESFHLAAGEMGRAFDIIAKGGKEGKFELKDMADQLPSLAPAFAALGYDGEEGLKRLTAALQIVRKETGTSGEAATAFMDVISKMNSETIANNFKKFGVNIRKEMKAAQRAGEDTLEAFIRISREAVNGDLSQLPRLFTDKQMLVGMRALINRTDDLRGMFEKLGDATGTVRADIARLAKDSQADLDRLGNSWDRLKMSFGKGLVDAGAVDVLDAVSGNIEKGAAIRKALEARGMDYWQRENWLFRNTFNGDAKDKMAIEGGWKNPAATDYGAGLVTGDLPDRKTTIPIPTPRPDPRAAPRPIVIPPSLRLPPGAPQMPGAGDLGGDPIGAKMTGGGMNVLAEAERKLTAGGENVAKGGEDAGRSMAEGGREAADALRAAGNDAANAIRSAVSNAQQRNTGRDVYGTGDL